MKIKIKKLHDDAVVPSYAKAGDAGIDLTCVDFKTTETYVEYDTGLAMEIPEGHVGLLFPRSSISKTGHSFRNSIGVIDSGYRGNLCGVFDIHNLPADKKPYEQYQRLVQICSNTLEPFKVILVDDIDKLGTTERGEGGFGSTGV